MPAAPVSTIPLARYPDIPCSFPDARHGFFLMGKRPYRTSDGGACLSQRNQGLIDAFGGFQGPVRAGGDPADANQSPLASRG